MLKDIKSRWPLPRWGDPERRAVREKRIREAVRLKRELQVSASRCGRFIHKEHIAMLAEETGS